MKIEHLTETLVNLVSRVSSIETVAMEVCKEVNNLRKSLTELEDGKRVDETQFKPQLEQRLANIERQLQSLQGNHSETSQSPDKSGEVDDTVEESTTESDAESTTQQELETSQSVSKDDDPKDNKVHVNKTWKWRRSSSKDGNDEDDGSRIDAQFKETQEMLQEHRIPVPYNNYRKLAALERIAGASTWPAMDVARVIFPANHEARVVQEMKAYASRAVNTPIKAMWEYVNLCIEASNTNYHKPGTKFFFVNHGTSLGDVCILRMLSISGERIGVLDMDVKQVATYSIGAIIGCREVKDRYGNVALEVTLKKAIDFLRGSRALIYARTSEREEIKSLIDIYCYQKAKQHSKSLET